MKKAIKICFLTLIALIAITLTSTVQANYQTIYKSNASGYVTHNGNTFIGNVRNMEASGQVMGLTETINSDLSPTSSNNIDVHLQKNTEYGAMILLSASPQYGKQGEGTARYVMDGTTTGNVYGVYLNENSSRSTYTSAGIGDANVNSYSSSINSKYINRYSDYTKRFNGDALLNWHGARTSLSNGNAIIRGAASQSAFSSESVSANTIIYSSSYGFFARAAVVCGVNF